MKRRPLAVRSLRAHFLAGGTAHELARKRGVSTRTVELAAIRHDLTRFDAPGVLIVELAAQNHVTPEAVAERARLLEMTVNRWRGLLMVSEQDGEALDAYYAERPLADAYPSHLDGEHAARLLGVKLKTLQMAMLRGTGWTSTLEAVKVRAGTRWTYRYEPRSVERTRALLTQERAA